MKIDFTIAEWIWLGALLGVVLVQIYWYGRYMAAPARRLRKERKAKRQEEPNAAGELPGVSVILCAHNESENLRHYLQALLTQDWPKYEVIVVDDGSQDSTREVIESYAVQDPRLRFTFVPADARVGSTKKLGLTLGAKAAQYDYLLLTDADCVPESKEWIRSMMSGFDVQSDNGQSIKEIVLGYGAYFAEKGEINRLVRYDTLFNGLHYLGAALCGHPYMGVGRNLAYRKSLFFRSGGFTRQMTSRSGDDDLFVNHVATKQNTAVVMRPESYTWSLSKRTLKEWWQQKRRHLSVSPQYKTSTKVRLMLEPLTRGLMYAMVLITVIGYRLSVIGLIALGLFLLRWIVQTAVLNVSARRMGQKRFSMLTILRYDITLPLVNLWMLIVPRRQSKWK